MKPFETWIQCLKIHLEERADQRAFTFLSDGEQESDRLSYAELDVRAESLAARLAELAGVGERALLIYPPGLDFVIAFLGCLYAGIVAVPCHAPRKRTLGRLLAIARDAGPSLLLTTAVSRRRLESLSGESPELLGLRWLSTDEHREETAAPSTRARRARLDASSLAFLQYTSGSTAAPKGVKVRHGNLLANEELIRRAFEITPSSVIAGWLPMYHDMGLIGNVLQPLYAGATCVLMSPNAFLQKPVRWLQAVSRYRATVSGGPDFAYALCARRISEAERAGLDLSAWRVAFNGAEPVRATTLDAFAEAFAPCGFRRQAFYPCYGLAEATLFVSGGEADEAPRIDAFDSAALAQDRVERADGPASRRLVGSGRARVEQLAIVDPDTSRALPANTVGEIWIRDESVAAGYWENPESTRADFEASPVDAPDEGPFLRTGDLGFVDRGELFVTGRLKDLIILRGRNLYPQDIEGTVEGTHPALRAGCGAAFSIEVDGEERVVVVWELARRADAHAGEVAPVVRKAISEEHEVQLHELVLVRLGTVPKTTSGKIRRRSCRDLYLEGSLREIARSSDPARSEEALPDEGAAEASAELAALGWNREVLAVLPLDERRSVLLASLEKETRRVAPGLRLAVDEPLTSLGLDSLAAIELQHTVEDRLGLELPLSRLLDGASLEDLAGLVLEQLEAKAAPSQTVAMGAAEPGTTEEGREFPLSAGQKALWFLHRMAPESAAYHISTAMRIAGSLDLERLRDSFQTLWNRHPALRTVFRDRGGQPVQEFLDGAGPEWGIEDLPDGDAGERLADVARRPLDPERGPLLRVIVLRRLGQVDGGAWVVLTLHHLVADFWSLAVLTRELEQVYNEKAGGPTAQLPSLEVTYRDYVAWQDRWLGGAEGEALWSYWRAQLDGELPSLELPTDRPRPKVLSFAGAVTKRCLSGELSRSIEELGQRRGATLFVTLAASFQVLLHRLSSQEELLLGTPTANRQPAAVRPLVGYFVNPVVLRSSLAGGPTFAAFLERTRQAVHGALEHQAFPFAILTERLEPRRDPSRSPLFQAMLILQEPPGQAPPELAAFALGEPGVRLDLGGLELESAELRQSASQFDLTLSLARVDGALLAALSYSTALFDEVSARRMLDRFALLLEGAADDPGRAAEELPLLSATERHQLVEVFNDTAAPVPEGDLREQLSRCAEARPTATALVFDEHELTYGELDRQTAALAAILVEQGVGPEVRVGVYMERSIEMVVGLWAVLKAGGAYLPLDPAYPEGRVSFMLASSGATVVLTQERLAAKLGAVAARVIAVDALDLAAREVAAVPARRVHSASLAYTIYTSGSTGEPKGVQISHRNVLNFFLGMDRRVGCGPDDTFLATTSISFDISVLEILWTLSRGARVVLAPDSSASSARAAGPRREMKFSLFYFASDHGGRGGGRGGDRNGVRGRDRYRLLLEGAQLADRRGFEAVWTPERHFHAFGGLYPNPSVTSAALATLTERVQLRAGSVVLPLQSPIRVAEEWALVDNLSNGRVGIAVASGWHADDFVFFPDHYSERKEVMLRHLDTVRSLWRGEEVRMRGGSGNEISVRTLPEPVQKELPVWLTAAGDPETFRRAGEADAHVLTHLLGQSPEEVADKIRIYREARQNAGLDPAAGCVTLMLHTFVGEDREGVRETVRGPFTEYLRSSVGLIRNLVKSLELPLDFQQMSDSDMDELLAFAFDRYFETSALFGDAEECLRRIARFQEMGVDEVACLIDFGIADEQVLAGLERLAEVRERAQPGGRSLAEQARAWRPTLMQCTPSMMSMLLADPRNVEALGSLRTLLLGGEGLSPDLARQARQALGVELLNMYGPTETTIWSSVHRFEDDPEAPSGAAVAIGRPIVNTRLHVLDHRFEIAPQGVHGELWIGGEGLSRGYLGRPRWTAERFFPDPWSPAPGERLYRTGDLASFGRDGVLEFLGRVDQQVKLRGHRIEPGELEVELRRTEGVREAAVVVRDDVPGGPSLVAYVVPEGPAGEAEDLPAALKQALRMRLPDYMVPAHFMVLEALPLTPNRKLDRRALPAPHPARSGRDAAPETPLEEELAATFAEILGVDRVGRNESFFDLGGHSLLMVQLQTWLRQRLETEVSLVDLLQYPTVAALAGHLSGDGAGSTLARDEERQERLRGGRERLQQRIRKRRGGNGAGDGGEAGEDRGPEADPAVLDELSVAEKRALLARMLEERQRTSTPARSS